MTRKLDWQFQLQKYLVDTAYDQFEPGKNDCAMFVSKAVKAMTGEDISEDFEEYNTLEDGFRVLKKAGYKDHVELASKKFEEIDPVFAQVGDIAVVNTDGGPALGIVQGEYLYLTAKTGRALLPRSEMKRAFRVE